MVPEENSGRHKYLSRNKPARIHSPRGNDEDSKEGDVISSPPVLRPPVTGEPRSDLRRDESVQGVPSEGLDPAHRQGTDAARLFGRAALGHLLLSEPGTGSTVRARYAAHHTAGHFFTRDDREGHGDPPDDPQHWFAHTEQEWISWGHVKLFVENQDEPMFL